MPNIQNMLLQTEQIESWNDDFDEDDDLSNDLREK